MQATALGSRPTSPTRSLDSDNDSSNGATQLPWSNAVNRPSGDPSNQSTDAAGQNVTHEDANVEPEAVKNKKAAPVTPLRERFVAGLKKTSYAVGVFFETLGNIPYKASSWTGAFAGKAIGLVLGSPCFAVSKIFKWAGDPTIKCYTIQINLDDSEETEEDLKKLDALIENKQAVNKLVLSFKTEHESVPRLPIEVIEKLNQLGRQVKSVELKNIQLPLRRDSHWNRHLGTLKKRWLIPQTGDENNHSLKRKLFVPSITISSFKNSNKEGEEKQGETLKRAARWIEFGTINVSSIADEDSDDVFGSRRLYSDQANINTFAPGVLTAKMIDEINKKAFKDQAMLKGKVQSIVEKIVVYH